MDYNLSDKTTLYGRYALYSEDDFAGFVNSSPYQGYDTGQTFFNQSVTLNLTHVFTPNIVNSLKFTFNRLTNIEPLGTNPVSPTLYTSSFALPPLPGTNGSLVFPGDLGNHSRCRHPVRRSAERLSNLRRLVVDQGTPLVQVCGASRRRVGGRVVAGSGSQGDGVVRWCREREEFGEWVFAGKGRALAEPDRVAELERKIGSRRWRLILKRALQRVEEQRQLRALSGGARSTNIRGAAGLPLEMDVTDQASVLAALGAVGARFGRVDLVVNAASPRHRRRGAIRGRESWRRAIQRASSGGRPRRFAGRTPRSVPRRGT